MKARENPFAADRVIALPYLFTGESWPALLNRLADLQYRAAIVGPCGSGKTTLLAEAASALHARGFHVKPLRLDRERPLFDPEALARFYRCLAPSDFVLFDGAEQLGRRAWADFTRRTACAAGMLITCHDAGRLPTLIACQPTARLLDELVTRLLDHEPPDRLAALRQSLPSAGDLHARHRGNVRSALGELYDRCAEQQ